ncbi:hypothetical protein [Flavobacterium sp. SOK18b]|uniref:hypothetical protein n=1 Tax=Flavobacterium sp. SOK18b TaxID=797900 RepID=UPI0015FCB529|nr:hypothetical protein [Flavobacterium sp. SOK18b]
MKNLFFIIAIITLVLTLNSCTADEIETEKPKVQVEAQDDVDPKQNGGVVIPPKK